MGWGDQDGGVGDPGRSRGKRAKLCFGHMGGMALSTHNTPLLKSTLKTQKHHKTPPDPFLHPEDPSCISTLAGELSTPPFPPISFF